MSANVMLNTIESMIAEFNSKYSEYNIISYSVHPPLKCRICGKRFVYGDDEYVISDFAGYECRNGCH